MPLLISIVIALILAGVILWAVEQFPVDPIIARIIRVVVVVFVVIYLLSLLAGGSFPVPVFRRF